MLSITGAIPKYLEEMDSREVTEKEIKRLCFSEGGFLVNEYEKIFNDIFQSRAAAFKKIVSLLIESKLDTLYICELKFRHEIDATVVKEVERKVKVLERKKYQTVRTILIYEGEIRKNDRALIEDYFYDTLKIGTILEG